MKEGWRMVKLGEVADFVRGPFGGSLTKSIFKENGYAVYEQQHAIYHHTNIRYFIDQIKFDEMQRFKVKPGDLIMSCSGTIGEVYIIPSNAPVGVINQALLKLSVTSKLDRNYFKNWLESSIFKDIIFKFSKGAAIPNVPGVKILKEIEIPLPPLEEQHRLVSILDASFEKIDALKKNAEENLKNTKALFQQVLAQELKPKEGWVEKKLGEVSKEIFAGGDAPKQNISKTITEQYPIPIYANAVEEDGLYGFTDYARVNEPAITVAARGSGTGYVLRRKKPFFPIVRLIVIIPNPSIEMDYMYYALKSINIRKAGAAIPQLTVPMLREYKISFPTDIEEQHRIVATLDTLSEKCHRLEQIAQQTILECDALKQSILRQAFSGEL